MRWSGASTGLCRTRFPRREFSRFRLPRRIFMPAVMNPQFRMFGELMRYTGRMCHLLDGGVHVAPVAILYHADAEWAGEAMFFQKPAHMLARSGIDFDIVPADVFAEDSPFPMTLQDGALRLHRENLPGAGDSGMCSRDGRYGAVRSPGGGSRACPCSFVDALPTRIADRFGRDAEQGLLAPLAQCAVVSLAALPDAVRAAGLSDIHPFG